MFERVTDPEILKRLNSNDSSYEKVTDPSILEKLNAPSNEFNPSFAEKLAPNILAGLAEGGHGILNTPYNVAKYLESKAGNQGTLLNAIGGKAENIPHQPEYDYPGMLGLPPKATLADKLVRGAAQFAPAIVAPEADIGAAGTLIGKIPKVGSYLSKAAKIGAPQAAFGATQDQNPLEGAAIGGATGLVAPAIESAVNTLRPSNIFRGKLSPEQLAKNLEATQGTNTGLGRVIESPTLNRLQENVLPHLLGTGAEDTMQKTAEQITQKGNDLLDKIQKSSPTGNFGETLRTALKEAAKDATKEKNEGFDKLNESADKAGLKVERNNFKQTAIKALQDIEQSPELKSEFSPDLYKKLKGYSKNSEGNNLKLSNIFRGKIGDMANEFYQNGNMHEYGIFKGLKDSLSKDIDESFQKASPELKEQYIKNQKDYAEKFALFEDADIVKFTRRGGDPDMLLQHFLKFGQNDRATLLSKLMYKLPEESKGLATYAHLSKAIDENGQVNPIRLASLYNKLGKNQKNVLIPDKGLRQELDKFSNLTGKNKEAFNLMYNPKTGARNTYLLSKIAQMVGGSTVGGIPGFLGATIGAGGSGRILNKILTSPTVRKSIVNKMIKNKEMKLPGRAAATGILNSLINKKGNE